MLSFERLKELKAEFEQMRKYNDRHYMSTITEDDVLEALDEAIARQSVKSEDVQRQNWGSGVMEIERLKKLQNEVSNMVFIALSKLTGKYARANVVRFGEDLQTLIDEAIARQSVKSEEVVAHEPCEWCEEYFRYTQGWIMKRRSADHTDYLDIECWGYCPVCGRRLEGKA